MVIEQSLSPNTAPHCHAQTRHAVLEAWALIGVPGLIVFLLVEGGKAALRRREVRNSRVMRPPIGRCP
jgi:hypothetical protein